MKSATVSSKRWTAAVELADELEPISGGRLAKPVGIAADSTSEAQLAALALDRFDEGPAPPA